MDSAVILVFSKDKSFDQKSESYKCAALNKKGEMSKPFSLSNGELRKKILSGAAVHVLYRQGCRWDIGDRVELSS